MATQELREQVASKIIAAQTSGYVPVVVVSAIGRTGDPYATDTLINFMKAITPGIPARELDLLMSCGEIISGIALVSTLKKMGYQASLLTGAQAGIITNDTYTDASILEVKPQKIHELAEVNTIVIVTGFQGTTGNCEVTTLGRGGSDTTAAALGVALDAEAIEIYTDVDGIMTADPRIVDNAKTLEIITYNEICNMAQLGAKVIHPRAVEIAMQKNIPLWVKCTFTDAKGTLVTNARNLENRVGIKNDLPITGITHISDVAQIVIPIKESANPLDAPRVIFQTMADSGISVDFINVYPEEVLYTVKDEVADKAVDLLKQLGFNPKLFPNCAKVSCVGAGMAGVPGVMARIVSSLTKESIQILQSADSHTTIWVLVRKKDMSKAIRALHDEFSLEN